MKYGTASIAAIQPNAMSCKSELIFSKYIDEFTHRASIQGAQVVVFPEDISFWLQWTKENWHKNVLHKYLLKDFAALTVTKTYRPGFSGLLEKLADCIFNRINLNYFGEWLTQERISHIMDRAFSSAAQKNNVIIVGGTCYVRRKSKLTNLCKVYDTDGNIAGEAIKHHLIPIEESMCITCDTNNIEPIKTKKFVLGVCICYDLNYPDIAATLSSKGAQVICSPSSGIRPYPHFPFNPSTDMPQIERSKETGLSIVRAYMCGWMLPGIYFDGHTSIVGPDGDIIAKSKSVDESEIVIAEVPIKLFG